MSSVGISLMNGGRGSTDANLFSIEAKNQLSIKRRKSCQKLNLICIFAKNKTKCP